MKLANILVTITISLALAGCGSDSKGTGGTTGGAGSGGGASACSPASAGMMGASNAACDSCVKTKCDSALAMCWGANWSSGSVAGSKCEPFLTCMCACASGNTSCVLGCYTNAPADCKTCLTGTGTCTSSMCATECTAGGAAGMSGGGGSTGGGGSAGGGTCADLKNCCSSITQAAVKQQCDLIAGMTNDAACGQILMSYRTGMLCR